tara:strand:+ start:6078 stop:6551 length:474 start_codon:yes stop_codon:yes gene_type:complete
MNLRPWQVCVIEFLDGHEDFVETQDIVSLDDFTKNRLSRIQVALPKGAGHTTLAWHIAKNYPTFLVYRDLDHLKEIAGGSLDDLHEGTEAVSIYQIHHAIFSQRANTGDSSGLEVIKAKMVGKKAVVVDEATSLFETESAVLDYLYTTSRGALVLLG